VARQLQSVLNELLRSLSESRKLAADAYAWAVPGAHGARPHISPKRRDYITEMAFLSAFQAWEVFIEESFVLYLWGRRSPRGTAPSRYAFPPNYDTAATWVVPEGRPFAEWTDASRVIGRAERFFKAGRPYAAVLRGNQHLLQEMRDVRNAVAHKSESARAKFETVVRRRLGTLPPSHTVGAFLGTTTPGTAPPISFLEFYIGGIDLAARLIIPS
jgi:hypothetical protein